MKSLKKTFEYSKDEIIKMYQDGYSINQLAEIVGCGHSTIHRRLKSWSVPRRPPHENYTLNIPKDEIKQLYLSGETSETIGILAGCDSGNVNYHLRNMGVQIRNGLNGTKMDKYIKLPLTTEDIVDLYNDGKTTLELANICDCSRNIIQARIQEHQPLRPIGVDNRKYDLDQNYFNEIDTQEKAYILGFIYADGCNQPDRNLITIAQKTSSKQILLDIMNEIYIDPRPLSIKPTKHNNGEDMAYLYFTSKQMSQDLEKWGVVARKSLVLKYPRFDLGDLERHFIRGYFDGDGWVTTRHRLGFIGTYDFINGVAGVFEKNLGVKRNKIQCPRRYSGDTCKTTYGSWDSFEKIYKYLYDGSGLFLQRKYNKFNEMIKD